ncbi:MULTISPECIES: lytic transglycosylase domain-containing protein [unclassified Pseudofrankia]|uniref:lytic transglycosylase domain-containing protein n=1 Tax=unclassified Pseudofrankia TaxID=2994372 RepID=UPI0009104532|nr:MULTISPECIES: lytic murein transglycosylase [unclassified Pseudofrankia]MDT3443492.1 lytic murein transglycosylase [Pseudofrankia sp. BMG5.37]OHV42703.1 hypothetical protein BCD48_30080 [Pseudofrankia sp. BMG5.36]
MSETPAPSPPSTPRTPAAPARPRHRHRRAKPARQGRRQGNRTLSLTRVVAVPAVGLLLLLGGGPASPHDDEAASSSPRNQPVRGDNYPMPPLTPDGDDGDDGSVLVTASPSPGDEVGTDALAAAAVGDGDGGLVRLSGANKRIPDKILAAYQRAVATMGGELPGCHLRWELLAGIGRVESNNANGRSITADGAVTPTILGVALDGKGGHALIRDTDGGSFDHDKVYDRAVGPMQFIPSTWKTSGRDGNSDGRRDPSNISDAALAAGGYLCARGRDLTDPAQLRAAIFSYNPSDAYVRAVLAWMDGYINSSPTTVPIPVVPLTPSPGSSSSPVPAVTLAAGLPSPSASVSASASPTSAACATITVTTSSLAATVNQSASGTALDVTGTYTAAAAGATGNVSIHAEARASSGGAPLAQADTSVPAQPAAGATPLARLSLPAATGGSVTVTLTTTPAGCAARTLTTVVVTGIPTATPTPTPSSTPSSSPSSSPTSSPAPSPTPAATTSSPAAAAATTAPPSATPSPATSTPNATPTSTSRA